MYGLILAPEVKNCIVIDKNGILSQKTIFRKYDQFMMGFGIRDVLDLENGETVSSKSKSNCKREMHGVKMSHRVFHCLECDNNKKWNR